MHKSSNTTHLFLKAIIIEALIEIKSQWTLQYRLKFSAMTILFHATTKPFLHAFTALLAAEVDGKLKDKCPDVRCKVECIKLM